MKRHDPYKRSEAEMKFDSYRAYGRFTTEAKKQPSRIDPIFTRVPDYGIKEVSK